MSVRKGRVSLTAPHPLGSQTLTGQVVMRSRCQTGGSAHRRLWRGRCSSVETVTPSVWEREVYIVLARVDIAGNEKYVCQQTSVEAETMRGIWTSHSGYEGEGSLVWFWFDGDFKRFSVRKYQLLHQRLAYYTSDMMFLFFFLFKYCVWTSKALLWRNQPLIHEIPELISLGDFPSNFKKHSSLLPRVRFASGGDK